MERRIIYECRVGSHLYGTSTPESDDDFKGVFLPSTQDLLGLQNCPTEWSFNDKKSTCPRNKAGDVDRAHYSIKRWLDLAAAGQPVQLEMLFAPENMVTEWSYEWQEIKENRNLFLSINGVRPFLGFATSQAHKACVKGENLILIRTLIAFLKEQIEKDSRVLVQDLLHDITETAAFFGPKDLFKERTHSYANKEFIKIKYLINSHGFPQVEIAGRQFNPGILAKSMLQSLEKMQERYGTRTQKAAEHGQDFKSLSHAVRLISEAEEFLLTGKITLPRPDADYILAIKKGQIKKDWFEYLFGEIDRLEKDVTPLSKLPAQPNRTKIDELCVKILRQHLYGVACG